MKTYLGYQDTLIAFASEDINMLKNLPGILLTKIEETEEPVELVNGMYCVGEQPIEDAKKDMIRNVRNCLLSEEVDPVVSNPMRWNDMTEEEQLIYVEYRQYLLDYTKRPMWWESEPLTLEEWKNN